LVPKAYSFSTITEPNIYKPIDIPFYASGVIDGSVLMQTGSTLTAIPGIEIHVQSVNDKYRKDIRVFADGSYYQMGIPPGKYIAYVDSSQLNVLGALSDPSIRSFDVRITADGDYIEGMKFLLMKHQAEKSISTVKDSITDQSIITIAVPRESIKDQSKTSIATSEQKYQILVHKKPKGFVIHISTWDTERRARQEAKKFQSDVGIKTIVEQVVVDGKSKYAVRAGVFSNKNEAFDALREIRANE
jgi:hypothetical protein